MKTQRKTATRKTHCGRNKFSDIKQKEDGKNKVTEQHLCEDKDKMIVRPHQYMMHIKLVVVVVLVV